MPITNTFGRMDLDKVWVKRKERQRQDPDPEKGGLLASIALRGVLMPVILEEEPDENGFHILYAGERRYMASQILGLPDIPFRFAREPSESEVQIIELEENLKREDLTWQECVQAVVRLHGLLVAENPSQTFLETGQTIGWHDGSTVARYVFITESWDDPAVRACGTVNEAYNLLQRRAKRAQANKLEEWLGNTEREGDEGEEAGEVNDSETKSEESFDDRNDVNINIPHADADSMGVVKDRSVSVRVDERKVEGRNESTRGSERGPRAVLSALPITQEDFLTWAPGYSGPKFNLIHCDFPYGIKFGVSAHRSGSNSLSREEGELYEDGEDHYGALLEVFVTHFDRFASESCHVMFWFSNRVEVEARTRTALLRIPGFAFLRFPLVWHKSDNAGFITPGNPRHVYETCLVGGRGDRPIVKYVSDAYSSPSDNSLHMSAKPEPMLRYFMGMFVDEHSRVLDPTCGSGSALRAAESLKAEKVLGLETNPEMVRVANKALLEARALRRANEGRDK